MRFTRRRTLDDGLDVGPARTSWRGLVLPIVLAVLLVGVSVTSVALLRDRCRQPAEVALLAPTDVGVAGNHDNPAGRAVARAALAATTYFTLDWRTIRADMDRMRQLGTPEFVDDYDSETAALARRVAKQKIALSAELPRGGVATEYLTADVAQVVVAIDVTTLRDGARRTLPYRTRITLERADGSWLVSAIDEVG